NKNNVLVMGEVILRVFVMCYFLISSLACHKFSSARRKWRLTAPLNTTFYGNILVLLGHNHLFELFQRHGSRNKIALGGKG
ncbi:hypothetical protein ACQWKP_23760, partial [Salmonella enterica subsp. enterica serovar Infantis]